MSLLKFPSIGRAGCLINVKPSLKRSGQDTLAEIL